MTSKAQMRFAFAAALLLAALTLCGAIGCSRKTLPYFEEVSIEQVHNWQPSNYRQFEGNGWQLKELFAKPTSAQMGMYHLVWTYDGKAFELKHIHDAQGLEGYLAWNYDVIGDKLYIYGPSQTPPRGWSYVNANGWKRISAPLDAVLPEHPAESGVYQWTGGQMHLVAGSSDYSNWFKEHPGNYFIANPGEGVVKTFELAPPSK